MNTLRALPLLVLLPAVLAAADRKPSPAAPNPDLVAIKDSIGALAKGPLHDLAESQAATNARIDGMETQLARALRGWQGVDLAQLGKDAAATRGAVAGLLADDAGIARQVSGIEARVQAAAEAEAAARKDTLGRVAAEDERLARWQQDARAAQEQWERQTGAGTAAALEAQAGGVREQFRALWLAVAGIGVLVVGVGALLARGRRAAHREVLLTLSRIGADLRHNSGRAPVVVPALNGHGEELDRRLRVLTETVERLAPKALLDGVGGMSQARVSLEPFGAAGGHRQAPGETLRYSSERPTVSVGGLTEPSVASRLLWPAEFLDPESPLSRWRFLLESHFEDASRPALPVLGSLLGLRALLARPGAIPAEIGAAAFRLSEALYAYWQSLPELSADDCQQASGAWLASIRSLIAAAAPRLELRDVLPAARIDLDLMHPVREGPGNHLSVADVFSWAVLDRSSGERPKVLHRALVASS